MNKKIEGNPLIIASDGKITMAFYNGKIYGNGIRQIQFTHNAPQPPVVEIETDVLPALPMDEKVKMFENFLKTIIEAEKAPDDVERLKKLLFDFVERTCTQPSTSKETEILPQMTDILVKLILP